MLTLAQHSIPEVSWPTALVAVAGCVCATLMVLAVLEALPWQRKKKD